MYVPYFVVSDDIQEHFCNVAGCVYAHKVIVHFLLLFPGFANKLLKFDKGTEQFSEYSGLPVPVDENSDVFKCDKPKCVGNKAYAFARFN